MDSRFERLEAQIRALRAENQLGFAGISHNVRVVALQLTQVSVDLQDVGKRSDDIATALLDEMQAVKEVLNAQDERLVDHEKRLRKLEESA